MGEMGGAGVGVEIIPFYGPIHPYKWGRVRSSRI